MLMNNLHPKVPVGECLVRVRTCNPAVTLAGSYFDYLDIASVDRDAKKVTAATKTAAAEAPSRARQIVHAGDVLVSTVRPNLNAVAHVSDEFHAAIASTGFCVLRPRSDMLDSRYLFHWVKSEGFVKDMVARATGANYPAVSDKTVKTSLIPLPTLTEQQQIADTLDKADALRRKDQELLQKYDELAQCIFYEMFDDKHNLKKAEECLSLIGGAAFQSADFVNEGVPVVRIGTINKGYFDKKQLVFLPTGSQNVHQRYLVHPGDLLMTLTGTVGKDDYGNVFVLDSTFPVYLLNQRVAKIGFDSARFTTEYLQYYFKRKEVKEKLTGISRGVRQANISNKDIYALELPVPSLESQEKFSKALRLIQASSLAVTRNQSDVLFNNLISTYFS